MLSNMQQYVTIAHGVHIILSTPLYLYKKKKIYKYIKKELYCYKYICNWTIRLLVLAFDNFVTKMTKDGENRIEINT